LVTQAVNDLGYSILASNNLVVLEGAWNSLSMLQGNCICIVIALAFYNRNSGLNWKIYCSIRPNVNC
jgi:hypothetical protein